MLFAYADDNVMTHAPICVHQEVEGVEPNYYLKAIHDLRVRSRRIQFLVEWQDFPDPENFTWEPRNHLPNDKDAITAFKEKWIQEGKKWPKTRF